MKDLLLVGLGGFLGSISRYGFGLLNLRIVPNYFQLSTLVVNLLGSLLIGLLAGYIIKNPSSNIISLFLITGFCGGFTTFSTFSLDNLKLIKEGFYIQFAVYGIGSMAIGLLLCSIGFWLTSKN